MTGSDKNYFDVQFATNQFSGNQTLLLSILEKFNQQYQHFDSLLIEQLQQNERLAAKQEVHSIKGVAGNLGMTALHNACKELELHLNNQIPEPVLDNLLQVYKQTISLVQKYLAEHSVEKSPETAAAANQDQTEAAPKQDNKTALIKALKRNEFISESKMKKLEQSLDLSPAKLYELQQAIDNLDYATAIQLLE